MVITALFILHFSFYIPTLAWGQVDVVVSPPPGAYRALLSDAQRALDEFSATIQNRSNLQVSVKFQVLLEHVGSDFSVRTNQDVLPITLRPNEVLVKTGVDLLQELAATEFTVRQNGQTKTLTEFFTGNYATIIPDGQYRLCVRAIVNNAPAPDTRDCRWTTLTFNAWVAPQLRSINNRSCPDTLAAFSAAGPTWQLPISWDWGVSPLQLMRGNYQFTVYVVELLPTDTRDANAVLQALQSNPDASDVVVRKVYRGPILGGQYVENLLPVDFSPRQGITSGLQHGYRYGVVVRVENIGGGVADLPNDGYSPMCIFAYGRNIPDADLLVVNDDGADFDTNIPDCGCTARTGTPDRTSSGPALTQDIPANTRIRIGFFRLKSESILVASGSTYSGEGSIKINKSGFKGRIRVRFNNLTIKNINGLPTVTDGLAEAINEPTYVPNLLQTVVTGSMGLIDPGTLPIGEWDNALAQMQSTGRFVNQLLADDPISMPFGLAMPVGDQMLKAGVFGMRFTPTKADLTFLLQTPPLGDLPPLNFGARQVCFTPNGLPDDGGKLTLGPDLTVQGDTYTLKLKGSNTAPATSTAVTSLSLDCRWGFKSLTLAGEVALRNDLIRPVTGNGAVKATFAASVSSFQDILLEANVTPFAFVADPDWAFALQNVSLDLSSSRNPTGMTLTTAEQPGSDPADNAAWTGIYAERVSLTVPSVLTGQTTPTRGTFEGLKIGFQTGVSFRAVVEPGLNLQTGRLGGWQFSIDTLRLTVENNQFGTPVMAGQLQFPLFDSPFRYQASYGPTSSTDPTRNLQIGVNLSNAAVTIAALKSQVRLVEGSRIGVVFRRTGGSITPELSAVFNGQWTVEDVTRDISLPNLAFTDLTYNTTRGFDISRFTSALTSALPSSQPTPSSSVSPTNQSPAVAPQRDVCGPKVSGFSLEISQITPLFEGRFEDVSARVGLQMNVDVKLLGGCAEGGQNTDSWSFGAGGTFSLTGRVSLQNGSPRFSEPQVGLTGVRINTDVSVCHVSGDLSLFENDVTYGNGFRGCIAFELGVGLNVKGSVGGIFGKTRGTGADSYSYFSVDGYIGGLNVMLGQYLAISGFTGGLSHKMTLRTNNRNVPAVDAVVNRLTNTGGCATSTPINQFPLVPNPNTTQIMFGVMFKDVVAAGTAFNGGMGMGAEINHNGGLSFLAVGGFMDFVKPPTEQFAPGADNSMMLRAKLGLMYDFVENKLTGTSTLYLNIGNVLKGAAEGDEPYRAGKMALYIARDDWYIFIGNPWKPDNLGDPGALLASMPPYAEVSLSLPEIGELGRAGAYFAMGTYGINGLPPLPPNSKLEIPDDDMRHELESDRGSANPALSHGGVAFGGWLYAGYKTPWVLGFRAGINVGAGFDVALLRYTRAATCPGMGGRFGINDFYGTGRAYAYVNGFLQYNDDGKAEDIYTIGMSMTAEFGGPNPTWVKGKLKIKNTTIQDAVYYFFVPLGAVVDFALPNEDDEGRPAYTTVRVNLGDVCEPSGGVEDNRSVGTEPIISQLIPADSVEALQPITVRLNRATGMWFDWYNPARNRTIKRRWAFGVALLKRANGTLIPLGRTERANNTEFVFTPQLTDASQMPTPGERLSFKVRYVVQNRNADNEWRNTDYFDERTTTFIVRATDYRLNAADVLFSYPAMGQQFYLPGEGRTDERFVLLSQPHAELDRLFTDGLMAGNYTARMVVRVKDGETLLGEVPFVRRSLPGNRAALVFRLPNNLPTARTLRLEFWKTAMPNRTANAMSQPLAARLLEYSFATSRYETFAEKMAATQPPTFFVGGDWGMGATLANPEGWDALDANADYLAAADGPDRVHTTLQATILTNTAWHRAALEQLRAIPLPTRGSGLQARSALQTLSNVIENGANAQLDRSADNALTVSFKLNESLRVFAEAYNVTLPPPPSDAYTLRLSYAYPTVASYTRQGQKVRYFNKPPDSFTPQPLTIRYEGYEIGQLRLATEGSQLMSNLSKLVHNNDTPRRNR